MLILTMQSIFYHFHVTKLFNEINNLLSMKGVLIHAYERAVKSCFSHPKPRPAINNDLSCGMEFKYLECKDDKSNVPDGLSRTSFLMSYMCSRRTQYVKMISHLFKL